MVAALIFFVMASVAICMGGYMSYVNLRDGYHNLWLFPAFEFTLAGLMITAGIAVIS